MDFATKVRILMAIKNCSQKELAKEVKVDPATISFWINSKSSPQYSAAEKIDKLLKESLRKANLEYKEQ